MIEINIMNIVEILSQNIRKIIREELINITQNGVTQNDNETIYTIHQVAEILGISVNTIYRLNRDREIGFYKKTGKCFYTKKNILEFIESGKVKSKHEIELEATTSLFNSKKKK